MNNLIIHYLFTFEINSHKSNALLIRKKCVFISVIIILKTKCDYIEYVLKKFLFVKAIWVMNNLLTVHIFILDLQK